MLLLDRFRGLAGSRLTTIFVVLVIGMIPLAIIIAIFEIVAHRALRHRQQGRRARLAGPAIEFQISKEF
jgi:hypothetical protein